jgi:hypothetical protein
VVAWVPIEIGGMSSISDGILLIGCQAFSNRIRWIMTFTWATQHDDSEVDFAIEKSTAETEHPTMNRA